MPVMTDEPAPAERLTYSVTEAAHLLGLSEATVYGLLDRGAIPELPRLSRRRLIPRWAVEALVARG